MPIVRLAPVDQREPAPAEAVRAADPETLEAIVDTYLPQVLNAARGAGLTREEAEDVAQETFAAFIEAAPRFEGRSRVRTFLFGILYHKISDARRDRARERSNDPIDELMERRFRADGSWSRPPVPADHGVWRREVRRALNECLDASPSQQRLALYLREVEGLSTEEICKILSVSVTNLGVMLYRVRNRTRECLETKSLEI